MPLFQSSLLLAYKDQDHCLGFLCTQSGGAERETLIQNFMIITMPINLWASTHFPAQRRKKPPKTWTTKSTDKIDAKVISMWFYSEPLGILVLHLSHVCRFWRCSCWGCRYSFICVKIKVTTLPFSWALEQSHHCLPAFSQHHRQPPPESTSRKISNKKFSNSCWSFGLAQTWPLVHHGIQPPRREQGRRKGESERESCILSPGSVSPQPSRTLMLQQAKLSTFLSTFITQVGCVFQFGVIYNLGLISMHWKEK